LPIPIPLSTPEIVDIGKSNSSASSGASEPQTPQRGQQLHRLLIGAVVDSLGR